MNRRPPGFAFAMALALAILAGLLVGWIPRYWPNTVVTAGLSLVALAWALTGDEVSLPPQTLLVVPLTLWALLQLGLGTSVLGSTTLRAAVLWAMCLVAFVLGSQILRSGRNRRVFLEIMLWVAVVLALAAILQSLSKPVKVFGIFLADDNVVGTLYYKNHFAVLMELAAPIALWKVVNGKLVSGGLCFAALFAATVTSASRAGTLVVLGELVVFLVIGVLGRRLKFQAGLGMVAVLMVLSSAAAAVVGTDVIWGRMQENNPYHLRGQFTESTLHMIPERPWLGFGMGTWRAVYPRFATNDMAVIVNEAHNDWVQWAVEGGIPFVAMMLGLIAWLVVPAARSVWGLGLVGVMVHAWVDYPTRQLSLQLWWFIMAGAVAQLGRETERRGARRSEAA